MIAKTSLRPRPAVAEAMADRLRVALHLLISVRPYIVLTLYCTFTGGPRSVVALKKQGEFVYSFININSIV